MANVMVVEDNVIYRELLRELCEMEQHTVVESSSAEEMLSIMKFKGAASRKLDLIICDFNMGAMNGYELIAELRQHEELRSVPILMISSTEKNLGDLLKLNGVAFLPKPSPNGIVIACIRKLLGLPDQVSAGGAEPKAPKASLRLYDSPAEILRGQDQYEAAQPRVTPSIRPVPTPRSAPIPPTPPTPPQPPAPPTRQDPALPSLGALDNGLKNSISQSNELTEFLIVNQQKARLAESAGAAPLAGNSPVSELIEKTIANAVEQGASDIHFEPQASGVNVKIRVDGVLKRLVELPSTIGDNLVTRIKVLCNLDITERRLPQDGQFSRVIGGHPVKFRVSTLPAIHGEKLVLRLLPSDTQQSKLETLGFPKKSLEVLESVLKAPNGLILVTGPTGSGKTTSLYGMLDRLNDGRRNILTVEDPVEYQLKGITQVQVNPGIGYTFERALRAFLRQDPNVILVGEIRDAETAEIALKAAVTGHIVLSTLHTNDAAGTVCRLVSMGLPPYLVGAASRLIIGQRLVRKLCPSCRTQSLLTADDSAHLNGEERARLSRVWKPRGCPNCHGVGYLGRTPIFEVLPAFAHRVRKAISADAAPEEISAAAVAEGMTPMRQEALRLVAEGITSLEEALTALHV